MNYKEYITEVTLGTSPELQQLFSKALKQVFKPSFEDKIDRTIKRLIDVREKKEKEGVVAYSQGNHIYVNPDEFYKRTSEQQIRYLLHEFMHVLQRYRGVFLKKFRPIVKISNKLNKILKKHLKKPLSVFLTGKNQELGPGGKWEILSYFMNDSIDWNAVDQEGRKKIIEALRESGIFNIDHPFWKKRLS